MRKLRCWLIASIGVLVLDGLAPDASAQCSGGRGGTSVSTAGTVSTSNSSSPMAFMNSAYPSSLGYAAMNPMAFQQTVYQQVAHQEQLNLQRQMMFAAKQKAGRLARAKVMSADDASSDNIPLHQSLASLSSTGDLSSADEMSESKESLLPAERLFAIATRAEKAGRDSTAERFYKRVIAMAPDSAIATRASARLGRIE